jgi:hypothetical protein
MPLIMQKSGLSVAGTFTTDQQAMIDSLITKFRIKMADDKPEANVLLGKIQAYSDQDIFYLLESSIDDINAEPPMTRYTLFSYQSICADQLVVDGAIVLAFLKEGVLQLRNQIDYSDSGLTIAMFNKTGAYQGWLSMWVQKYMQDKAKAKAGVIPKSNNSGFVGVGSEFAYRIWW